MTKFQRFSYIFIRIISCAYIVVVELPVVSFCLGAIFAPKMHILIIKWATMYGTLDTSV